MKIWHGVLAATSVVIMPACSAQPASTGPAASAPTDFYLTTKYLRSTADLPSDKALQVPGISGAFVRVPWAVINPSPGVYDWTVLDAATRQLARSGKKLSLGVITGTEAPDWLERSGVKVATVELDRRGCFPAKAPAVWDSRYVNGYVAMMKAVRDHLAATGATKLLSIVKVTGMTQRTLELRLPVNNRCSSAVDDQMSAIGYRPGRVLAAWKTMANGVAQLFPNTLIVQPILQVQGFPAIDDSGKRIAKQQVNVGNQIVQSCITGYSGRCGIQWNGLNLTGRLAPRVLAAREQGATIGWQTNLFEGPAGGAGCQPGRNAETQLCTAVTYTQLLERGVKTGARFIEVWEPDILKYPQAFVQANRDART